MSEPKWDEMSADRLMRATAANSYHAAQTLKRIESALWIILGAVVLTGWRAFGATWF